MIRRRQRKARAPEDRANKKAGHFWSQKPSWEPVAGIDPYINDKQERDLRYLQKKLLQIEEDVRNGELGSFSSAETQQSYMEALKKNIGGRLVKQDTDAVTKDYEKCFKRWLLGKEDLLNSPKITPHGYTSLAERFPRATNFATMQLDVTDKIRTYLVGLYIRGPQSEREIEIYFKYLVYPVQEAIDLFRQANGIISEGFGLDEFHAGATGELITIKGDPPLTAVRSSGGAVQWPKELVFEGKGRQRDSKIPLALDPCINKYMRPAYTAAVSYEEYLSKDYSALGEDVKVLWEVANDRSFAREDRMIRPGTEETRLLPLGTAKMDTLLNVQREAGVGGITRGVAADDVRNLPDKPEWKRTIGCTADPKKRRDLDRDPDFKPDADSDESEEEEEDEEEEEEEDKKKKRRDKKEKKKRGEPTPHERKYPKERERPQVPAAETNTTELEQRHNEAAEQRYEQIATVLGNAVNVLKELLTKTKGADTAAATDDTVDGGGEETGVASGEKSGDAPNIEPKPAAPNTAGDEHKDLPFVEPKGNGLETFVDLTKVVPQTTAERKKAREEAEKKATPMADVAYENEERYTAKYREIMQKVFQNRGEIDDDDGSDSDPPEVPTKFTSTGTEYELEIVNKLVDEGPLPKPPNSKPSEIESAGGKALGKVGTAAWAVTRASGRIALKGFFKALGGTSDIVKAAANSIAADDEDEGDLGGGGGGFDSDSDSDPPSVPTAISKPTQRRSSRKKDKPDNYKPHTSGMERNAAKLTGAYSMNSK
jgi:hypothetical protein